MKKIAITLSGMFLAFTMNAQSLLGAWKSAHTSAAGEPLTSVIIFSDSYQSTTIYNSDTGEFISTTGGAWVLEDDMLIETVEFDSAQTERVGTEVRTKVLVEAEQFTKVADNSSYTAIDHGAPGALQGAWLMSGRVQDGVTQMRATDGPRKTMKILSGTRFQWIAYNTETKQFMGTGGGTYTTTNGVYTEQIEFFSRDNARVGASLTFDYKLVDGQWHHSGKSSKGDPLYEIWQTRG